jgi:hypothetical protein
MKGGAVALFMFTSTYYHYYHEEFLGKGAPFVIDPYGTA